MSGKKLDVNRPVFPTRGDTPEEQRLVAGLNEIATSMLNSGALLGRVSPGPILRPVNGQLALSWGTQNRAEVGVATGIALLPAIRPEFIGAPLYINKLGASGALNIKPTGNGSDGKTPTLIDRSATGIRVTAAGLTVLMTDGQNWHSTLPTPSTASTTATVATGAVGEIQLHDTTYSPVGLWQFQSDLNDTSGNGLHAAVDIGDAAFEVMAQRLRGVRFNGLRLRGPSASLLALRSDMTIEFLGSFEDQGSVGSFAAVPAAATTGIVMAYTGGVVDSSADYNYQYQVAFPDVRRIQWFSEHGVGVNDTFVPTNIVMPPPGQPFHCAAVRENSRVQFYVNGAPFGTLSPSMFTPDGGAINTLWFGGVAGPTGTSAFTTGNNFSLASVKLVPTSLNAAAVRGEYNRTLGPFLGTY